VSCLLGCRSPESVYQDLNHEVDRGEYKSTLAGVDAALQKYGARDAEWEWHFRLLKARILVSRSQATDALSILEPEPPASLASSDISEQRMLFRGIAHRYTQQFAESERDFEQAERLATALQPQHLGDVLNARGALEVDEKQYSKARATFHRALDVVRGQKRATLEANILGNLARLAISEEHFDEATDLSQAALQRVRSLGMKSLEATILGNLGWSYFELGDFDNALEHYNQAAEASKRSGMTGYQLYWLTGVANSYRALHNLPAAEELLRHTLELARDLKDSETINISLNALAEIMLRGGRLEEAGRYNQEAIQMEEEGRDHLGALESKLVSARIETKRGHYALAETALLSILQDKTAKTPLRWEAHARLAELYVANDSPAKAEREYRQSLATIDAARCGIDRTDLRLSYLAGGIEFYGDYINFLARRGRPDEALEVAELSRARSLMEGLSPEAQDACRANSPSPTQSIQDPRTQRLARRLGATLLFYWIGQEQSYLWVITPAKTAHFTLPKAAEIEPVVKSYQKTVLGMRDAQDPGGADGKRLYTLLVEPAKKLIHPGSRVIVLPSESLYGLNFETLIVPDPQPHFWIEDVTVTTASSLTLLDHSAKKPEVKGRTLLLVGDTEQPSSDFPLLTQAKTEMQKIEHYFPETSRRVLEGKEASPSGYLSSHPERYSYIHFVTHGTASQARPLESAVILSKEGDSYKLYARDIVQHHLSANLVTISACNGSGTRAYSGEGLVGLSWAFLRAGAHNVIAGLWEVSDVSTPQLMDALYSGLNQGKDPATALRDAKLAMLHSADAGSVFRKPFYWAPFQLYAGS
jgi:CHAT domain-containing protein